MNDDYNPTADFSASVDECYRVIRERVAAGGPGWGGWPAGVHGDAGGQGVTQQPRQRPDSFSALAAQDCTAPLPPPLHQPAGAGAMKWYKRDPAAALEGMIGLTAEERGYYNTLLDLLYAHAPRSDVTDVLVIKAMAERPQVWRRVKAKLIAKGKVRETDGKLTANRVETEVKLARNLMDNMVVLNTRRKEKQRLKALDVESKTTTTTTTREEKKKEKTPLRVFSSSSKEERPNGQDDDEWTPEQRALARKLHKQGADPYEILKAIGKE